MIRYLRTHALMYEYYRQAQEIVPPAISKVLHRLFTSEAYQIVNSRYNMTSYYIFSCQRLMILLYIYYAYNNALTSYFSTVQILENVAIEADIQKGRTYFEGSVKFMKTLNEVLDMLIDEVGGSSCYLYSFI